MDEAEIIQHAREGDLNAFNRLVLEYQDMAFNLAARMLGDDDAAEDVTQTAFLSAYRSLDSFRGGSFRAWVMRMVSNACYDELRRRKRRPTVSLEPVNEDDEEIESPAWLADDAPSPEVQLERAELDQALQTCLQGLPEEFRSVVLMVDVEGLDYQEVSLATGKPLGTVKSRLARARLRMRDCLRQYWELLPSVFRLDDEVVQ
ncbi:MAG: sigma-70 family RNA polymerase sigma factor [Chloroflexi bacterium]|nr:MAG: sigma-70 family RNA polymerase sigma factor [Chloroflexota bacterium]